MSEIYTSFQEVTKAYNKVRGELIRNSPALDHRVGEFRS